VQHALADEMGTGMAAGEVWVWGGGERVLAAPPLHVEVRCAQGTQASSALHVAPARPTAGTQAGWRATRATPAPAPVRRASASDWRGSRTALTDRRPHLA
jgi:hypothetical protein